MRFGPMRCLPTGIDTNAEISHQDRRAEQSAAVPQHPNDAAEARTDAGADREAGPGRTDVSRDQSRNAAISSLTCSLVVAKLVTSRINVSSSPAWFRTACGMGHSKKFAPRASALSTLVFGRNANTSLVEVGQPSLAPTVVNSERNRSAIRLA